MERSSRRVSVVALAGDSMCPSSAVHWGSSSPPTNLRHLASAFRSWNPEGVRRWRKSAACSGDSRSRGGAPPSSDALAASCGANTGWWRLAPVCPSTCPDVTRRHRTGSGRPALRATRGLEPPAVGTPELLPAIPDHQAWPLMWAFTYAATQRRLLPSPPRARRCAGAGWGGSGRCRRLRR